MKKWMILAAVHGLSVAACKGESPKDLSGPDSDSSGSSDAGDTSGDQGTDRGGDAGGASDGDSDTGDLSARECLSELDKFEDPLFDQMQEGFVVRRFDDQGSFEGGVKESRSPDFHKEAGRIGDCRLMTYKASSCDEDCFIDGRTCFNGECVSTDLTYVSADPLVLFDSTGFKRTIPATDMDKYFYSGSLLNPPRTEWVALDAVVDDELLSLRTCAPAILTPDPPFEEVISAWKQGEDLVLSWTDIEPGARIYLHMTTGIGTHGGISPVEIECEGPDRGELLIPAEFLSALDCPECWNCGECGYHDLIRYHTDEKTIGGKIVRLNNIQVRSFGFFP